MTNIGAYIFYNIQRASQGRAPLATQEPDSMSELSEMITPGQRDLPSPSTSSGQRQATDLQTFNRRKRYRKQQQVANLWSILIQVVSSNAPIIPLQHIKILVDLQSTHIDT